MEKANSSSSSSSTQNGSASWLPRRRHTLSHNGDTRTRSLSPSLRYAIDIALPSKPSAAAAVQDVPSEQQLQKQKQHQSLPPKFDDDGARDDTAPSAAELAATIGTPPRGTPCHSNANEKPVQRAESYMMWYFRKWKGVPDKKRADVKLILIPHWTEIAVALWGGFVAMSILGAMTFSWFGDHELTATAIIGSFGASAVLLYAAPASPLTQPRNLMGGHFLSALVGVAVRMAIVDRCTAGGVDCQWLGCGVAVSLAIGVMIITDTVHPPGGATALIGVIGEGTVGRIGFWFALLPATVGPAVMLLVCLVFNNFDPYRSYPQYWW